MGNEGTSDKRGESEPRIIKRVDLFKQFQATQAKASNLTLDNVKCSSTDPRTFLVKSEYFISKCAREDRFPAV